MKEILLTKGHIALVDDADYGWLSQYKWHSHNSGYAATNINGRIVLMHRLIMNTPEGMDTDHINHNPSDNRRENLRVCTHAENMKNTPDFHNYNPKSSTYSGAYSNSTSGVSGVTWEESVKKWRVRVQLNGNRKSYGLFETLDEAITVHQIAFMESK